MNLLFTLVLTLSSNQYDNMLVFVTVVIKGSLSVFEVNFPPTNGAVVGEPLANMTKTGLVHLQFK